MTRILTVDDSRAMRNIITKALKALDVEILQAENGKQGLEVIEAEKPDLILLDVTMPVMDGPTMLKELRARGNHTPVILVTAESDTNTISGVAKDGINDYIIKPPKKDLLQAKVRKMLNLKADSVIPVPPGQTNTGGGATVASGSAADLLVIDDVANVVNRFRDFLPSETSVSSSVDRDSALLMCQRVPFKMIVIDYELPEVEIVAFAREVRKLQPKASLIALLLKKNEQPIPKLRSEGFDNQILKPFDEVQIKGVLDKYLFKREVVVIKENVLTVAEYNGPKEALFGYFSKVKRISTGAVDGMVDACYDAMILDATQMSHTNTSDFSQVIATIFDAAQGAGLDFRLVGPGEVQEMITKVVETSDVKVYGTLDEARSG